MAGGQTEGGMARKHHKLEEIAGPLRQVEVLVGQGKPVVEAIRAIGVTEPTYYRWRSEYGGLKLDQVVLSELTPSTTADVKGSCGGHAVRRTSSAMPALRRKRLRRREAGTCWL
jgi:hypothetical protein